MSQWIIMVLVIGGRDFFSPPNEGKDYTCYIVFAVYTANWVIIYYLINTLYKNLKNQLNKASQNILRLGSYESQQCQLMQNKYTLCCVGNGHRKKRDVQGDLWDCGGSLGSLPRDLVGTCIIHLNTTLHARKFAVQF